MVFLVLKHHAIKKYGDMKNVSLQYNTQEIFVFRIVKNTNQSTNVVSKIILYI